MNRMYILQHLDIAGSTAVQTKEIHGKTIAGTQDIQRFSNSKETSEADDIPLVMLK